LVTASLFDSFTENFISTLGHLAIPREDAKLVLLNSGKVLVVGGGVGAELFDPPTGTFSSTGTGMNTGGHTATLVSAGRVLVTDGGNAELYDPLSGSFAPTPGRMTTTRSYPTASPLDDGTVLLAGGIGASANLQSAELYHP